VDERFDDRLADEAREMEAGLAESRACTFDGADPEAATDERVQVDASGRDIAPRRSRLEADVEDVREPLDLLRGDERDLAIDLLVARVVAGAGGVPVALEADPGESPNAIDGDHWRASGRRDVDRLDDGAVGSSQGARRA